jgi:predicted DNA-binding protein
MSASIVTTSLPEDYVRLLDLYSKRLKRPKNKILEEALQRYFEMLKRAEFTEGFRRVKGDPEMNAMAEEGLEEYIRLFEK